MLLSSAEERSKYRRPGLAQWQQFKRLSKLEQEMMNWLAIQGEAVSLNELEEDSLSLVTRGELMASLTSLRRRSLIELVGTARFTLQPVIMEFIINLLIRQVHEEITLK